MGRKSNKQMNALKAKVFQALLWIKKRGGIYCNKWMPGGVMLELIRNEFGDFSNLMSSSRDLNYNINYVPNSEKIDTPNSEGVFKCRIRVNGKRIICYYLCNSNNTLPKPRPYQGMEAEIATAIHSNAVKTRSKMTIHSLLTTEDMKKKLIHEQTTPPETNNQTL
jgi:hypothetical protein